MYVLNLEMLWCLIEKWEPDPGRHLGRPCRAAEFIVHSVPVCLVSHHWVGGTRAVEQDRDWHYLCPIFGTNSVLCREALKALSCCKDWLHSAWAVHSNRFCELESSRLGYPACPAAASCYRSQNYSITWLGLIHVQDCIRTSTPSDKAPSFAGCLWAEGCPRAASLVLLCSARSWLPSWTLGENRLKEAGRAGVNTARSRMGQWFLMLLLP